MNRLSSKMILHYYHHPDWMPLPDITKALEELKERRALSVLGEAATLEKFCRWMSEHGYLDDDWWSEKPTAIEQYMNEAVPS